MELTKNQKDFIARLWQLRPEMQGQKDSSVELFFTWLHNPLLMAITYWHYYAGGPELVFDIVYWWFVIIFGAGIIGLLGCLGEVGDYINGDTLENRVKHDPKFLSHKMITSFAQTPEKIFGMVSSATLAVIFFVTGNYLLMTLVVIGKVLGEYIRAKQKKALYARLEEISGNLFIY